MATDKEKRCLQGCYIPRLLQTLEHTLFGTVPLPSSFISHESHAGHGHYVLHIELPSLMATHAADNWGTTVFEICNVNSNE
jgi:hypothetical protein